jgi:hypothetical protein
MSGVAMKASDGLMIDIEIYVFTISGKSSLIDLLYFTPSVSSFSLVDYSNQRLCSLSIRVGSLYNCYRLSKCSEHFRYPA